MTATVSTPTTVLKALLDRTHQAHHRTFCHAYDRAARATAPEMVGKHPARATFYRWLSGDIRSLPHPGHRRVLAAMFPAWTLEELFTPWRQGVSLDRGGSDKGANLADTAGVMRVFPTRAAFIEEMPPGRLFDTASLLDAAGLSLNLICQQYSDQALVELMRRAHLRLLFLDPDGTAIEARNSEEGHETGHLSNWTRTNLGLLARLRQQLPEDAAERVQVRLYDQTIRFNIILVDGELGVVQPYMPRARGLESPTFVLRAIPGSNDLFSTYRQVFDSLWEGGSPA